MLLTFLLQDYFNRLLSSSRPHSQSFKLSLVQQTPETKQIEPIAKLIEPAPPKPKEVKLPPLHQEITPKLSIEQVAIAEPPIPEQQPSSPPINATVGKFSVQNTTSPSTESKAFSGVFDSKLRQRLSQSGAASSESLAAKSLSVYQNNDGSEVVQRDGKCFTVVESDISPTGKQWSLPTNCMGHLTESDRITNGLKAAMKTRYGESSKK